MDPPPPIVSNSYNSRKKSSIKSPASAESSKSPKQTLYIPLAHNPPASVQEVPIDTSDIIENVLPSQSSNLSNELASNQLQFDDGFVAESMDDLGGLALNGDNHSQTTNGNLYNGTDYDHQNRPTVLQDDQKYVIGNGFHNDPEAEGQYDLTVNSNIFNPQPYNPENMNLAIAEQQQSYVSRNQLEFNEGVFTEIPTATQIQVSYTWKLSKSELLSSEKLVSVPFGPDEWSWQIVLYPYGTGDASNQFMSAFLRVVKNLEESNANDLWERPISCFILKIKKGSATTPLSVNSTATDDFDHLVQYSEPEFKAFSEQQKGWGFHEFCPLPIPDEVVSDGDIVRIEAQIIGVMMGKAVQLEYEEQIPLSQVRNQQIVRSSIFGASSGMNSFLWQTQFSPFVDEFGNFTKITGHLCSVVSNSFESSHYSWKRGISTFSMKLLDPSSREILASKCLTGGFSFNEANQFAGWDEFLSAETFLQFGIENVMMQINISWDPRHFTEHQQMTTSFANQEQENSDWRRNQYEVSQVTLKNAESALKKHDLALEEIQELRKRIQLLSLELQNARVTEKEYRVSQVRLSTVKEKLSKLRVTLDNDLHPPTFDANSEDISSELASCKLQLANLFHEKAQVDLKLSQALSELQFVNRSSRDNLLLAPIPSFEEQESFENDPIEKIYQAIEISNNEVIVGRAALDEFKLKTANRNLSTLSNLDRAGLTADISMVQCGLDVAHATLTEAGEDLHLLPDVTEFLHAQKELQEVRQLFSRTRYVLDENPSRSMMSHASSIDSQGFAGATATSPTGIVSPLFPPPIVPSLIPKNRGKRSSNPQFSEIEQQSDLKAITTRIESLTDMIKTGAIGTPVASGARPFRPSDIEPWTPKESSSVLDHTQLQSLLQQLKERQKSSITSIFLYFLTVVSLFFGVYSFVFVVCGSHVDSPVFQDFSPLCHDFVLPFWEQSQLAWHQASEQVVVHILPSYMQRIKTGALNVRKMTQDTLIELKMRATKQGSGVHLAREKFEPIHPQDPDAPKTTPIFTNIIQPIVPPMTTTINTPSNDRQRKKFTEISPLSPSASSHMPPMKPKSTTGTSLDVSQATIGIETAATVSVVLEPASLPDEHNSSIEPLDASNSLSSKSYVDFVEPASVTSLNEIAPSISSIPDESHSTGIREADGADQRISHSSAIETATLSSFSSSVIDASSTIIPEEEIYSSTYPEAHQSSEEKFSTSVSVEDGRYGRIPRFSETLVENPVEGTATEDIAIPSDATAIVAEVESAASSSIVVTTSTSAIVHIESSSSSSAIPDLKSSLDANAEAELWRLTTIEYPSMTMTIDSPSKFDSPLESFDDSNTPLEDIANDTGNPAFQDTANTFVKDDTFRSTTGAEKERPSQTISAPQPESDHISPVALDSKKIPGEMKEEL